MILNTAKWVYLHRWGYIFEYVTRDVSQKLLSVRYAGDESKKDIHEKDTEYLKKSQSAAKFCSEHDKWNVITAMTVKNLLP